MNNIKENGSIVLNSDDSFYDYHKKYAYKQKLNLISFGIKDKTAMIKLVKIKRIKRKFLLFINVKGLSTFFYSNNWI